MVTIIKIIIACLSFWALADNPYSYYQFLRIAIFVTSCYFAYKAYDDKQEADPWIILYALIAILFNPIFPIYMTKSSWAIFNVATGIFYLVSILKDRQIQKKPPN